MENDYESGMSSVFFRPSLYLLNNNEKSLEIRVTLPRRLTWDKGGLMIYIILTAINLNKVTTFFIKKNDYSE